MCVLFCANFVQKMYFFPRNLLSFLTGQPQSEGCAYLSPPIVSSGGQSLLSLLTLSQTDGRLSSSTCASVWCGVVKLTTMVV